MEVDVTIQTRISKKEAACLVKLLENITLNELREAKLNMDEIQCLTDITSDLNRSLSIKCWLTSNTK